jgi:hypothetical protein
VRHPGILQYCQIVRLAKFSYELSVGESCEVFHMCLVHSFIWRSVRKAAVMSLRDKAPHARSLDVRGVLRYCGRRQRVWLRSCRWSFARLTLPQRRMHAAPSQRRLPYLSNSSSGGKQRRSNPKPQTPNPKPQIPNLHPQTPNSNPNPYTPYPIPYTLNSKP